MSAQNYLKVSLTKVAIKFRSTRKLKPRYIGPFDIIAKVDDFVNELALPHNLKGVHNVFYLSILKKYVRDESYIIPNDIELDIWPNVIYEEKQLKILDRWDKVLGTKFVPLVKSTLK